MLSKSKKHKLKDTAYQASFNEGLILIETWVKDKKDQGYLFDHKYWPRSFGSDPLSVLIERRKFVDLLMISYSMEASKL